jgi:UDP-N-acetyl-D-mannosaminuronic acid dehydrogenase
MTKLIAAKNVTVIGLGYIGLPTAALLASSGYQVHGVDINPGIVERIQAGEAHIAEADLDMLVEASVVRGKLTVSAHVEPADIFIIAVPTPLNLDKSPDLSAVEAAFDSIAPQIKRGDLIILESTCPVGTTKKMAERLSTQRTDIVFPVAHNENADIHVAYCPERVLPGQILKELIDNDRVVGGLTPACTQKAIDFYQSFVKGECLATDSKTAEMCKLTENSFRDVNIALANELSMICDQQGINVWEVIQLANHHPRVNILQPGPGVGGHCIALDPWFIINQSPEQSQLLRSARGVNDSKPQWVLQKIDAAINKFQVANQAKPTVACLGNTFKANVDDVRESPALEIVSQLAAKYPNQILVVEPNLDELPDQLFNKQLKRVSFEKSINDADILVLLVDHTEFKNKPHINDKEKILLDFKGLWSKQ